MASWFGIVSLAGKEICWMMSSLEGWLWFTSDISFRRLFFPRTVTMHPRHMGNCRVPGHLPRFGLAISRADVADFMLKWSRLAP